jgi:hypothetical protein
LNPAAQLVGLFLLPFLLTACSGGDGGISPAVMSGPGADVRALTGTRTRVVWVQEDGTDPLAFGNNLALMGLDSDDGQGERMIGRERRSYVKPMLTPGGDRIVFSSRAPQGAEIFIVNWDGSGLTRLADGYALAVWKHPADGSDWVYTAADTEKLPGPPTVTRFRIDKPDERELVWDKSAVSLDTFQVSADGRRAAGLFPWPEAGIAELPNGAFRRLGEGCWTALANARGPLLWYFDGAHRNVTMVDVETDRRWGVSISRAPGFDGAEVFYPRWTNHSRFLAISGPYNQGGGNQVRSGGDQVEVHLGRFSADFTSVEAWARVTNNSRGDMYADVWIEPTRSPHAARPQGPIGPAAEAAPAGAAQARAAGSADAGRAVVDVHLTGPGPIPSPESILPYRHALVVNDYDIVGVLEGTYSEKQIRIAQWAIRDGRVMASARKAAGTRHRLTVERYDAHSELEGERLITASDAADRPVYYEVSLP